MRTIGFSTGALAFGDFRIALEMLRDKKVNAIELSALKMEELKPLIQSIDQIDLSPYTHISFHAPTDFDESIESRVISYLHTITERGWPITIHPDMIFNPDLWLSFGSLLCIENMDKRKLQGRYYSELFSVFKKLPEATFCFDFGHARQVDPTMSEAVLLLERFRSRLRQMHLSDVSSKSHHCRMNAITTAALNYVSNFIPENLPIILEIPVLEKEINDEVDIVLKQFKETTVVHCA
jgi:hypothetical protein